MRLAFVAGLMALGLVSTTPAHADFAVVKFASGYCRVYADTPFGPPDGRYLSFWSLGAGCTASRLGKQPTWPCNGRSLIIGVITGGETQYPSIIPPSVR